MDFITDHSSIDAVSLEAIAAFVQKELIAKPQLSVAVSDFTALVGPGMDVIKIPRFGSFTAERKVASTALSAQALTAVADSLALSKHDAVYTMVENIAQLQSSVNVQMLYAERIASAILKKQDQEIFEEIKLVSTANPDHTVAYAAGSAITKADFTNTLKLLIESDVDLTEGSLWCALPPAQYKVALGLSDFVDADKWLSGSEQVKATGILGKAYGFNILCSSIYDATVMWHSSAVGFARQMNMKYMQAPQPKYLAVELAAEHVYGVKQLQAGKAAVLIA